MLGFRQIPMFSWVGLLSIVCVGILSLIYILHTFFRNKSSSLQLPPGPFGLPIIGHVHHMLGDLPHHNLHKLSQKYGSIMQLRLGHVPTVVVSSPEAAELFLKTHDTNFASRPQNLGGDTGGMGSAQYGPYWRNLRKLCSIHLLSMSKVDSFKSLRKDKVRDLVRNINKASSAESAEGGGVVDMSNQVGLVIENITYGMIFGVDYINKGYNIKECIRDAEILAGAFNLADYITFLRPFDLQGLTKRTKDVIKNLDDMLEKIIVEHEHDMIGQQKDHRDFIDVMLSLMKPEKDNEEKLDRGTVKALTLDMLAGAMDTTITAIDWVLAELVRHPQVMKKIQEELVNEVGLNRMVEESDLVKLAYMEMVVKETLRLHPVAPLLIPHESIEDISIKGYHIAKRSRIIVNVWSVGRDPNAWSNNPEEFYPERFMNTDIDVRGHDLQLIPFGAGRRKCPGIELGLRQVQFVLAQLVHCFNWELPDGMSPRDLDMKEKFGVTVRRAIPLLLVPTYRLHVNNI
ncbi:hypothetical protein AQUCO_00201133v1 [Aquilegia coerulea]|uniref:Cytochrome P450 n=1 Tax=Aquilegia coerulea TaxID=218851 RepID=A0A2G5F6Q2_AQUCA|nr:hypothetical protein AQUCO_00201133v1 [Aquilegia coerulea]